MMKKITMALLAIMFLGNTAFAGGILTNTNQSVNFLRNPARDAAIGLDGVYSNPAGVAFLSDGLHLGFNWQYAHQTRTITSTNPLFALGAKNNGLTTKEFEGVANAPFIPSLQAAYNKNNWSFQFNFSVPGGGGKCEFDKGIGSFETVVGSIASLLKDKSEEINNKFFQLNQSLQNFPVQLLDASVPNVTGYDVDGYMKGQQYYFGFQLGVARKINEHLSVYAGLRLLYGTASYEARLNNIRVMNGSESMTLPDYFMGVNNGFNNAGKNVATCSQFVKDNIQTVNNAINQYVAAFMDQGMTQEQAMQHPLVNQLVEQGNKLKAIGESLQVKGQELQENGQKLADKAEMLAPYANGMNLKSDQSGWGIAPVLGIDYKIGNFNFAAKYEFKTRMRMKNDSDLKEATVISAMNKYVNGTSVPEDSPALLALGAQWEMTPGVRLNLGYHHFFDKSAHWYEHSEKLLDGDTNEYLAGAEWDVTKKLQVSGGVQLTRYGLSDAYMNDMSFVVNSWTFGLGVGYQVTDKVKVNAAYFQTNYENYDMNMPEQNMSGLGLTIPEGKNSFTRTNRVVGLGVEVTI